MKRLTQLVALMVAVLFAGQSALAEGPCSQWLHSAGDHAPNCCIKPAQTAAHPLHAACHASVPLESMQSGCSRSGCQMATVQAVAQAIPTAKFRAGKASALVAVTQLSAVPPSALAMRPIESTPPIGPTRYMLFQVFRI